MQFAGWGWVNSLRAQYLAKQERAQAHTVSLRLLSLRSEEGFKLHDVVFHIAQADLVEVSYFCGL